jgi:hypothetical protein
MLHMASTSNVDVATVNLPAGGLVQERGSVLNARLRMSKEHVFAEQKPMIPQPSARMVVVSSPAAPLAPLAPPPPLAAVGA